MGQVARGASVYLDANILIRMTEGVENDRRAISEALSPLVDARARFITSELTFTEVLVHPFRFKDQARIERYNRLLSEFVEPVPISREVLFTASQLRADLPALRTPDALHVATAMLESAALFITGDRGIKGLPGGLALQYV